VILVAAGMFIVPLCQVTPIPFCEIA